MNTTSHYQLNQWDGTDRILRTDFNADNLKTDDAIAAVREELTAQIEAVQKAVDALTPKAGLQLLKTIDIPQGSTSVSLADIDWSAWKAVHMNLTAVTASGGTVTVAYNGDYLGSVGGNDGDTSNSKWRRFLHLIFYPLYDARRQVYDIVLGSGSSYHYHCENRYQDFTQLNFIPNSTGTLLTGSTLEIWGEK